MQTLLQDARYALRQLRRSLGFTAIAVASLALAIGANTTIFSFANQMLFVRLGVPHPEQLRMFMLTSDDRSAVHDTWGNTWPADNGRTQSDSFSYPVYQQLRKNNSVLEEIFAFKQLHNVNVSAGGAARVAEAELVSGNLYGQMEVKPQLGRPLVPADDGAPGSGTVAVISDAFWHRSFGGAPDVLGKTIVVNSTPVSIIGVNPRGFTGPDGVQSTSPDVFLPLSLISVVHPATGEENPQSAQLWWLQLMARSKPHVSLNEAEAAENVALDAAIHATMAVKKNETIPRLALEDGSRGVGSVSREFARPLYVLLGFSGLVLMLACANIANLMLARAATRQREMGVRMALGAGRVRILRQVLTESVVLAVAGGAAGLVLGYLGRNLIPWLTSEGWDNGTIAVSFDWRVFGFTSSVTLLTGIVFGIIPAWASTRADIQTALKEGARGASRRRKAWSGKAIVGFQLALSTLLVIAAAFFLRTLVNLNSVDPGFRAQNLLLMDINPPVLRYPPPKDIALQHRIEQALAAVPGVEQVSLSDVPLVADSSWTSSFLVEGVKVEKSTGRNDQTHSASLAHVGQDFFSVMSIPILQGRGFNAQDTETSTPVAVINQALARKFFPHTNPIGKRFRLSDEEPKARWMEIVGICADTHYRDMKTPPPPLHFDLYRQQPEIDGVTFIVRSQLAPDLLLPSLRRAVALIDPDLPLSNIRTQQQQIKASMQQATLFASLTAGFGLLALALASVGIYGIMAYSVSQRTNEIGIRLALGAMRPQVRAMVLREAGWLAGAGLLIGVALAMVLIRIVESMLYGLTPGDPATLGIAVLLLTAVALSAAYIPADRASRVEPIEALRHD